MGSDGVGYMFFFSFSDQTKRYVFINLGGENKRDRIISNLTSIKLTEYNTIQYNK